MEQRRRRRQRGDDRGSRMRAARSPLTPGATRAHVCSCGCRPERTSLRRGRRNSRRIGALRDSGRAERSRNRASSSGSAIPPASRYWWSHSWRPRASGTRRHSVEDLLVLLAGDAPGDSLKERPSWTRLDLGEDRFHRRVARPARSRRAGSGPAGLPRTVTTSRRRAPGRSPDRRTPATGPLRELWPAEQVYLQSLQVRGCRAATPRPATTPTATPAGRRRWWMRRCVLPAPSTRDSAGALGSPGQRSGSGPVPDGSAMGSPQAAGPARAATTRAGAAAVSGKGPAAPRRAGTPRP